MNVRINNVIVLFIIINIDIITIKLSCSMRAQEVNYIQNVSQQGCWI